MNNSNSSDNTAVEWGEATTRSFDWSEAEAVPLTVVETVGAVTGIDATELPPLHTVIDPDGLDSLFDTEGDQNLDAAYVTFEYYGCRVKVRADGTVSVLEL